MRKGNLKLYIAVPKCYLNLEKSWKKRKKKNVEKLIFDFLKIFEKFDDDDDNDEKGDDDIDDIVQNDDQI